MSFSELPWQAACVFYLGFVLIACGVIGFIAGLIHEAKRHRRELRRAHWAVGRDVYRDIKGLTKP
jgi:hypothetical protein